MMKTNYQIFRGKCKEACEALQSALPDLELVRGYYTPLFTGKAEPHWWLKTPTGTIVDPTKWQFECQGSGDYEEFDGTVDCEQCGKSIQEKDVLMNGNYPCCSELCCLKLVGLA